MATSLGHVCFVAASVPWTFGAYQAQQSILSQAFHRGGYRTSWMPRTTQSRLPPGVYSGWDEIEPIIPDVRAPTEAERMASAHLQFVGVPDLPSPIKGQPNILAMNQINQASLDYGIDTFIFLMDVGNMYLNQYAFTVPSILWLPYHYEELDGQQSVLARFTAVAALAPTTARSIDQVQPLTRVIPHSISRSDLNADADAWEARVARAAGVASLDRAELRGTLFDSARWDRAFRRRFDAIEDDTFVVLMQGGNYEDADRKGWVPSLRSFAKFHRDHPEIKKHLWLHAIDSTMVEQDMNHGKTPPVAVKRSGVGLRVVLEDIGIPGSMYTLDENLHDRPTTNALKRHADLCLHTSKAEGFGMVVLECQALGTPVITTEYTAMRDYTKYGVAVPPAELQSLSGATFFAVPDTDAIARAIYDVASGALPAEPLDVALRWIDEDFSIDRVYRDFHELVQLATKANRAEVPLSMEDSFESRPLFAVTTDEYPRVASWANPWTLYHAVDVTVDYEFVQRWLVQNPSTPAGMAIIPTLGANGRVLPSNPEDNVHNINPKYAVLLQTWMLRQTQEKNPYIWSAVFASFETFSSHTQVVSFPAGVARVVPTTRAADADPYEFDKDEL